MSRAETLRRCFHELYGREPRVFSAPGRVNLIGEHTDYNEGFVLPMAADRRTYVAGAVRQDGLVRVYSLNLAEQAEFDLEDAPPGTDKSWVAYVAGIARVLTQAGYRLKGADLLITSDVPIGAGLSSSAALEISAGYALLKLSEVEVDLMELALAGQTAEHVFVGTRSGLMDQLTAAFGERNHAIFIDCRTQERKTIPLKIPNMAVVVCDTTVKHELATSAYNERRRTCEQAVEILREKKPSIRSLRDVTLGDLAIYAALLPDVIRRRCSHVITENLRTLEAVEALTTGDVDRLGELINDSHESLRDDYQVSCPELDLMVTLARGQAGVAGARMMGGGFGGTTVNLVRRDEFERFRQTVSDAYTRETGLVPSIIAIEADDGVRETTEL